ncbi:MAG: hypothetical protein ACHQPI_00745 [Thermoanaerobaculia bacterium]
MNRISASFSRIVIPAALLVALLVTAATPANAQAILKVNDTVNFKFGALLQGWADWQETQAAGTSTGYAQNLFIRRARFILSGQLAKDVSFFLDTENANLGKAPKNTTGTQLGTGFQLLDFFGEWKIANEFALQGGLILIPLCRNCNESAASQLSLDYGSFSFQESAPTGSTIGRDTGFQAKGYFLDDRLEYRAGGYQGMRTATSHNSFRFTGRLQYNFLDVEKGQFYAGTYLNTKKVLAIGASYDTQSDYKAYAADAFLNLPFANKQFAVTAEFDYIHYDGGLTFTGTANAGVFKQDDVFAVAGFYISSLRLMPFLRYESQAYADDVNKVLNKTNYQIGLTYYPYGHNLNIRAAYSNQQRPNDPTIANTSEFTIQMQVFYF